MTDAERRHYVEAALVANGYRFDTARIDAIAEQFARIETIAGVFVDDALPVESEPAVVFRP
ncbi:hypothetical protein BH10PSE17_BH10PSE17_08500 [soil metagenome]